MNVGHSSPPLPSISGVEWGKEEEGNPSFFILSDATPPFPRSRGNEGRTAKPSSFSSLPPSGLPVREGIPSLTGERLDGSEKSEINWRERLPGRVPRDGRTDGQGKGRDRTRRRRRPSVWSAGGEKKEEGRREVQWTSHFLKAFSK